MLCNQRICVIVRSCCLIKVRISVSNNWKRTFPPGRFNPPRQTFSRPDIFRLFWKVYNVPFWPATRRIRTKTQLSLGYTVYIRRLASDFRLQKSNFPKCLQFFTRYSDAAISNATINAKIQC